MRLMKLGRMEVYYWSNDEIKVKEGKMLKGNYAKLLAIMSAVLTFALTQINAYAAGAPSYDPTLARGLPKIAQAEELVLDYGFAIGRLVCIVMCIMEIIKSIKDGNANAFWGIMIKYAIALGSFMMLPFIFDMIAGFFA